MLLRMTQEGARKISDVGERYETFRKDLKRAGGRLIGAYALLGPYDYAALVEVPSEKDLMRVALTIGKRGAAQTQTYPAIPMEDFADIAKGV